MSKSLVIAVAFASLVTAGTAIAADVPAAPLVPAQAPPPAPVFSWTGFYVGAHAGPGWSLNEQTFTTKLGDFLTNDNNYTGSGFLGGAQAGFNYQVGPWVWGVEGDFSWAGINGESNCIIASPTALLNCDTKVGWLGTAAARIGFVSDKTLVFVKGGGAWVQDKYDLSYFMPPPRSDSVDQTRLGWMFGTGVEYAFYGSWSAKAEYEYLDFGTRGVTFPGLPAISDEFIGTTVGIRQRIQLVKFGLNYRFGVANY